MMDLRRHCVGSRCVLTVLGCHTKEHAALLQSTLDAIVKEIETYDAE